MTDTAPFQGRAAALLATRATRGPKGKAGDIIEGWRATLRDHGAAACEDLAGPVALSWGPVALSWGTRRALIAAALLRRDTSRDVFEIRQRLQAVRQANQGAVEHALRDIVVPLYVDAQDNATWALEMLYRSTLAGYASDAVHVLALARIELAQIEVARAPGAFEDLKSIVGPYMRAVPSMHPIQGFYTEVTANVGPYQAMGTEALIAVEAAVHLRMRRYAGDDSTEDFPNVAGCEE